ncbi:hypothetical protein [Streptomyces sp. CBMA123]|uniref:hypothetical protein n=1 Tax=Streptomyces sp. CBMA123 TaxID=1896313 RepID=UPI001661C72F|nr:hypothetical protein [Streptomyces sp. CBMA123]
MRDGRSAVCGSRTGSDCRPTLGFWAVVRPLRRTVTHSGGPNGPALWASGTYGHPGGHLAIQPDGNIVIYDSNNQALWATGTYGR